MKLEDAIELCRAIGDEPYEKNKAIERSVFDGLVILRKYDPKADIECAEHDEVWASTDYSEAISDADLKLLFRMGWSLYDDGFGFHHFV